MNPMPKPVIHGLVLCLLTVIGVAVVAIEQAKIEHDHPLPDQAMDQGPVVGFSLMEGEKLETAGKTAEAMTCYRKVVQQIKESRNEPIEVVSMAYFSLGNLGAKHQDDPDEVVSSLTKAEVGFSQSGLSDLSKEAREALEDFLDGLPVGKRNALIATYHLHPAAVPGH